MQLDCTLRNEVEADYLEVEKLTRETFWNLYFPGCDEHYLVHIMRKHPDFVPEMDFVALHEGRIVGNIMYTRSRLEDESGAVMDTLSFGPLCVAPKLQRRGVGSALIDRTKAIAIERGCPAILIYGDPHNYVKHGFGCCKDFGVANEEGKHPLGLLVLELKPGALAGHAWRLFQSEVFKFDPRASAEFDASLEPKEKKRRYSQVLFSMQCRAFIE
jgi:putative acetyltransferase